jgi:hypothetical protein
MTNWHLTPHPDSAYWRAFPPAKTKAPTVGGIVVISPFRQRRRPRRPIVVGITSSYR